MEIKVKFEWAISDSGSFKIGIPISPQSEPNTERADDRPFYQAIPSGSSVISPGFAIEE